MTAVEIFIKSWVLAIVKDFIDNNWNAFQSHCDNFQVNPDEISKELDKMQQDNINIKQET